MTPQMPFIDEFTDGRVVAASEVPTMCAPFVELQFWLDAPGHVRLWFRGAQQAQVASVGDVRYPIAAHRVTGIGGDVPGGASKVTVDLDWATSEGPALVKATLTTEGET